MPVAHGFAPPTGAFKSETSTQALRTEEKRWLEPQLAGFLGAVFGVVGTDWAPDLGLFEPPRRTQRLRVCIDVKPKSAKGKGRSEEEEDVQSRACHQRTCRR